MFELFEHVATQYYRCCGKSLVNIGQFTTDVNRRNTMIVGMRATSKRLKETQSSWVIFLSAGPI